MCGHRANNSGVGRREPTESGTSTAALDTLVAVCTRRH